jgi:hypothetical protein
VSEETERLLDSPQEALGPALGAGAEDLDEGSGTDERLEAPLPDILGVGRSRIGEGGRRGDVERSPRLLKAALAYARRGIPVFPCEPGGKAPLTHSGFWDATTDARRIKTWWDRWPYANVGVPTGERSGLLILDIDPRAGGPESLAALERTGGPLPETTKARTGGGGVHVFFRYPAEEGVRNSAGRLGPGLDVRGEGGYVIVPPSRTQSAYEWLDRTPPADPTWLLECLRAQPSGEGTLF